ncbi:MAG: 50S ribosome-binding GTPase [Bifidobacteriaceae bacterium]|jgi:energy-coupling factor transporter ATP-binding protein EcfA2|nr:50S ribosome-binding GTPase [Bifidobacteriaceae bacterium]
MTDDQVQRLRLGIEKLREAARLTARRLDESLPADALAVAELLVQRLDRGVDHTIVAISGGTGSGKSSLFNAIAEMAFSEVGVVRPTTSKVTACVWGTGAEELLDWLGVERGSWIKRDSVLESHIGELRGMILLDLPDYDSALAANHEIADRALPLADVLIWVTDPQKYADPALHERFVAAAKAHQGRLTIVVLNQIDAVGPADAEAIGRALTGLLVDDGLTSPAVALTSAKTGAGVDGLRSALMARTAHRTMAMTRTASDLAAAARQLAGAAELAVADGRIAVDLAAESTWLGRAAAAVVSYLVEAVIGAQGVGAPRVLEPNQVRQAAAIWAAEAAAALPERWAMAVAYSLASPQNLAARLGQALEAVAAPPRGGFWARLLRPGKVERRRRAALEDAVRAAVESVVDRAMARPTRQTLEDRGALAALLADLAGIGETAGLGSEPLRS